MDTVQEARAMLAETQSGLQRLMERALKEQRFGDISAIAAYADGLSRLVGSGVAAPPRQSENGHPQGHKMVLKHKKVRSAGYPKFVREGDKLVKIGWSKKAKAEYEHKAPRDAVFAFVRHLAGSVQEGKVFVVEDLLPVPDPGNGGELPAYQVYLVLAWLRCEGIVKKKGRDGYAFIQDAFAAGAMDRLWEEAASR